MSQTTTDRTTSAFRQARDAEDSVKAVAAVFDRDAGRYEKLLPSHISLDDFRNAFLTSVQRNPRLLDADRSSFWLSLQQAAGDGLKCDNREAALVIFADEEEDEEGNKKAPATKSNKPKQVVYMPMIRGLRKLVRNTGLVSTVEAELVYKGEVIRIWRQDGQKHMEHVTNTDPEADRSDRNIIGSYAIVVFKDGTWQMEWMSRADIEKVRAVSRARSQRAPWQGWYGEMSRKTPLRRLIKQLDTSPEIAALAVAMDKDPTLGDTIDGEATEIAGAIAARPTDTPRTARTADRDTEQRTTRQTSAGQRTAGTGEDDPDAFRRETTQTTTRQTTEQTTDQKPAGSSQAAATTETAKTTSGTADATGQRSDQGGAPDTASSTASQQDGGFEAWLVNSNGVETRPEPYGDAVSFATALAALCRETPPLTEDIWEANEPAIADCLEASDEARAIIDAIKTKPTLPAADPEGTTSSETAFQVVPVPLATTGSGKPHWPNYTASVQERLDQCPSPEAATAQFDVDKPTYMGKSMQAETQIGRHYRSVLARLSGVAQPSRAEEIVAGLRADVLACRALSEVREWSDNPLIIRRVAELKSLEGGAAMYEAVQTFVAAHVAELKAQAAATGA